MATNHHTLAHALRPADTNCRHNMADITNCVICERRLSSDRVHVDTCGGSCYQKLLKLQRAQLGGADIDHTNTLGYLHSLIAEADTFFFDAGLEPTNEEQRECMLDPARLTEALDMLDDWQARLRLPARLRERLADVVAARGKSKKG